MNKMKCNVIRFLAIAFIAIGSKGEAGVPADEAGTGGGESVILGEEHLEKGEFRYEIKSEKIEVIESPNTDFETKTKLEKNSLREL